MGSTRLSLFSSVLILFVLALYFSGCSGTASSPSSSSPSSGLTGGGSGSGSGSGGSGGSGGGTGTGSQPTPPATDQSLKTDEVAANLESPWSLAFAPDGRLFVTETPGRLRVITSAGLIATPVFDTGKNAGGEGGLTGMDLDPNFASNGYVYIHYCVVDTTSHCRVARVIVNANNVGTLDKILLDYPVTSRKFDHSGGRLKIGPDGLLYLTVGDHRNPPSAQDLASWDGKIVRMNLDGTPASGNPFSQNAYVYTYGMRDPQGLAWDSAGNLYATEHGEVADDRVDLITKGANYGWPTCDGVCNNPAFTNPVKIFNPQTIPPSGASFYHAANIPGWDATLLIAVLGLDGSTDAHEIYQLQFDKTGGSNVVFQQRLWQNKFGRLRDVIEGPDGFIYFSTNNRNGQSKNPGPRDDRIIRAHP